MSEIIKKEGSFESTDGIHKIAYRVFLPNSEPKMILQFCHGMGEHSGRYDRFGKFLAEHGILFCISDHLGHGKSINLVSDSDSDSDSKDDRHEEDLGYFGSNEGYKLLIHDAAKFTAIMKKEYPDTPYVIGGHSMGSFVVRGYLSLHAGLADAAIIMGTGDITPLISVGKHISKLTALFHGDRYRSKVLDKLSFGGYVKKIPDFKTSSDWLSRDENEVKKFCDDPLCGFIFTVRGLVDVSSLIAFVSSKQWAQSLEKACPVLIISGDADPVGDYGAGVVKVAEKIKAAGVRDVTVKLYKDARHELLNETNSSEVMDYIYDWLKKKISEVK